MNATLSKQKTKPKPQLDPLPLLPQRQAQMEEIIRYLLSLGKVVVSRAELRQLLPYSARTIRRFELKGWLKPLKATRTKSYLVADLATFIQEVR